MYLARLEDNTLGIGAAGNNKHILGVLNGSNSPGSQDQLLPGLLQVDDVDAVGLLFEDVLLHRGLAVIRANVGGCSQHLGDVILGYSKGSKSSRHCEQSFLNCSYEARCSQCHMECRKALAITEDDITKMLAATTHIGSDNSETTMEQYIFKKKTDGVNIINLKKTWEKLVLAARAIAAAENPQDVYVVASRPYTQRAVLKFARYIGCSSIAGRFTPGAFTNQIQAAFREPRLLLIPDPRSDHQPVTEASYANIPIVAFTNVDSPTKFIDIAVPCNNKSPQSIGLMWWFLAREVLRLRGSIPGKS